MIQTVEGILDPNGSIRLLDPLGVNRPTRILVTVVPDESLRNEYREAHSAVTTEELRLASAEQGGKQWNEVLKQLESR